MQLGTKIKQLRTERQLSQEALASELQVSRQAVAKWETQTSLPSTANLLALCKLFGISMTELTGQATRADAAPKKNNSRWYLAGATLVFGLISLLAWGWQQKNALPPNLIGYADGETSIWIAGLPVYLYVLFGLTAFLAVVTGWRFIKTKRMQNGEKK